MGAKHKTGKEKVIFLTGATGQVGQNLIPEILRSDEDSLLILLIRGTSNVEVEERLKKLLSSLSPACYAQRAGERVRAVRGDITLPCLGLSESCFSGLASRITHIIHSAASVRFQLPLEEARKINVEGTKNVMDLARQAKLKGRLQRVAYIGTAFVSGNRSGLIKETELDCGQQFTNSYEQTKFEAEQYVRQLSGELPLTIFRPSIIVGDSRTGSTSAFNVIYGPLKYISRGLVKFLPGSPGAPLDVVPVDFVCQAICHILFKVKDGVGRTFHLCAGREKATTAGEIVDLAVEYFNQFQPQKHIPQIRFIPARCLRILELFLSRPVKEKLKKLKVFVPYLNTTRCFDTANTRAALKNTGIEPPLFRRYFRPLLRYSLLVNWGEQAASTSAGQFFTQPQALGMIQ